MDLYTDIIATTFKLNPSDDWLRKKQSVFLKDYTDLPDADMVQQILGWANGSPAEPPRLYSHLLVKTGDLYYIRDEDFKAFLAQFYDSTSKRIVRRGGVLPVMDIMMFVPLIPLGQLQSDSKMDEAKFEAQATQFAGKHFEASNQAAFRTWLVNGPDPARKTDKLANPNHTYPPKHPNPGVSFTSWVLVVRLLRNIFSHQKDLDWRGLSSVKTQVLSYMRTPINFALFCRLYEACRKP